MLLLVLRIEGAQIKAEILASGIYLFGIQVLTWPHLIELL